MTLFAFQYSLARKVDLFWCYYFVLAGLVSPTIVVPPPSLVLMARPFVLSPYLWFSLLCSARGGCVCVCVRAVCFAAFSRLCRAFALLYVWAPSRDAHNHAAYSFYPVCLVVATPHCHQSSLLSFSRQPLPAHSGSSLPFPLWSVWSGPVRQSCGGVCRVLGTACCFGLGVVRARILCSSGGFLAHGSSLELCGPIVLVLASHPAAVAGPTHRRCREASGVHVWAVCPGLPTSSLRELCSLRWP